MSCYLQGIGICSSYQTELHPRTETTTSNAANEVWEPWQLDSEDDNFVDDTSKVEVWENQADLLSASVSETSYTGSEDPKSPIVYAFSPFGEIFAVAQNDRLTILSPEKTSDSPYSASFTGQISDSTDGVEAHVSALLCCPIASQMKSGRGRPDWCCIIAGFSSGRLKIFTETGVLLISQVLHNEPIIRLHCQAFEPAPVPTAAERPDELFILFSHCLVIIDGFSLVQTLRACRNQVAKAKACGEDFVQPSPLAYRKWSLRNQHRLTDIAILGNEKVSAFDTLCRQSVSGYSTPALQSPSQIGARMISSGCSPFVAFYHASEVNSQPLLSAAAREMASKLTSAFFGKARSGIPDVRRIGESIVLSPNRDLAALTDSFGRVTLLHVPSQLVVRIWKGYRDAQVGWILATSDKSSSSLASSTNAESPSAQYLVIYASRRGILEVWAPQLATRISAFNVARDCTLLYHDYGMFGVTFATWSSKIRSAIYQCVLFDPATGHLSNLVVPYHLSLMAKKDKRAHDLHLLKQIRGVASHSRFTENHLLQALELLLSIKIASIKQEAVDVLLSCRHISPEQSRLLLSTVLEHLEQKIGISSDSQKPLSTGDVDMPSVRESSQSPPPTLSPDERVLRQHCLSRLELVKLFVNISRLAVDGDESDTDNTKAEDEIDREMKKRISSLVKKYNYVFDENCAGSQINDVDIHSPGKRKVKFDEKEVRFPVSEFLRCFYPNRSRGESIVQSDLVDSSLSVSEEFLKENTGDTKETISFQSSAPSPARSTSAKYLLDPSLLEVDKQMLADFIFSSSLTSTGCARHLYESLCCAYQIPPFVPEELLALLLQSWTRQIDCSADHLHCLDFLLRKFTNMKEPNKLVNEENLESLWWRDIRFACQKCDHAVPAFSLCLLSKEICVSLILNAMENNKLEKEKFNELCSTSASNRQNDWELIHTDIELFYQLFNRMLDVVQLQSFLRLGSTSDSMSNDLWKISVCKILESGIGVISERLAIWLTEHRFTAKAICFLYDVEADDSFSSSDVVSIIFPPCFSSMIPSLLGKYKNLTINHFPNVLQRDSVLVNCAWESIVAWNRQREDISRLEDAINHLKLIERPHTQHGILCMIWATFLAEPFKSFVSMLEKVGKPLKERLCFKAVNLNEANSCEFAQFIVRFLSLLCEANCRLSGTQHERSPVFVIEDAWQCASTPRPLWAVTAEKRITNYQLVRHHFVLSVIVLAIQKLVIKGIRPYSLFDDKGQTAFFLKFTSYPYLPTTGFSSLITGSREKFLESFIIRVADLYNDSNQHKTMSTFSSESKSTHFESSSTTASAPDQSPSKFDSALWLSLVFDIGPDLEMSTDVVRLNYCCELYSRGFDSEAEKHLNLVSDLPLSASRLLTIASQRIAHFVFRCDPPGSVERLSLMSPTVSTWLKSQEINLVCCNPPLQLTIILLNKIKDRLDTEQRSERNIVIELLDLVTELAK